MLYYKIAACLIAGTLGSFVAQVFGGWSDCLTVLLILMAIDYISGLVVAGIFHRSPKSENGALESKAGLKGLFRKLYVIFMVVAAHMVDRLLGTNYLRDAVAIAFCVNELISLMENAGLMGLKLPKFLYRAIDMLKEKAGENERTSHPSPSATPSPEGEGLDSSAAPQNDMETDREEGGDSEDADT